MMNDNINKISTLIAPIIKEEGCELLDVEIVSENGKKIVRLFLEKEGGVALGDCSKVSHAIEDILAVEGLISGGYSLEVSSPGLNRPLKTKEHFQAVLGEMVCVTTIEKIDGRRKYRGLLKKIEQDDLIIHVDNQDFTVPLSMLSKANLEYNFSQPQKMGQKN